jgi:exopolysaccharide biosynthesis polyprenyl glycosylphosphotransferase
MDTTTAVGRLAHAWTRPLVLFPTRPASLKYLELWSQFGKRAVDLTGALLSLSVLSPVWILAALLVKLSSKGPVLFRQQRVGMNGKTFGYYKFRTMYVGDDSAERKLRYARLIKGEAPAGKIVNEKRITPIGRFLRRSSIDELPQLINVLKGEMSLIGPRPPIPYEVEHFDAWHMERFKAKPGMTGMWQVNGRSELPFEEMIKLDVYYLRNWSFWLDAKILMKTVPAVLTGRGAI